MSERKWTLSPRLWVISTVALLLACVAFGQGGRFEESRRLGLAYLKDGKHDKAAARLEEVWEADPGDAGIAEALAIAYLNGEERRERPDLAARAYELMDKSVAAGGKATFLVLHSHERLALLQGGETMRFCSGRLSVTPGRLTYVSDGGEKPGEDSFDVAVPDRPVELVSPQGAVRVRVGGKTLHLQPRSRSRQDGERLVQLIARHAGAKAVTKEEK